ncbi:MAG: dTMP kinase [SAR86 cluster bacterium]|uniref:Thymidylate kinase n=1 Tax=SAR86 cluster bacterium TaxID=2030880 RepID=A0A838XYM8_9GAMM|nr:dTMP kinase [SAR86 cluster bacterium]|tara:strand:+ start:592 stop:1191 length:600 start_codon:yes stop_codon:yes gene_type:complete
MKLISFEGIEGVGKSTQINLIQEWLKIKGFSSKLIREPGSTEFGEKIRDLLLSNDSDISAHTELLLMFAARAEMVNEHMVDSKEDIILCDRYFHASIAYQGYGRKLSLELIENLIQNINCPIPDLTIIYDLDVRLGFKRKANDDIDRIESAGENFFEDVRKGYQQIAKDREEVVILDASQSIDVLNQQTKELIQPLILK